jgi:hypothetical protein
MTAIIATASGIGQVFPDTVAAQAEIKLWNVFSLRNNTFWNKIPQRAAGVDVRRTC